MEIRNQNPEDLRRRAQAAERFKDSSPGWKNAEDLKLTEKDIDAIDFPSWREKFVHRYTECRDRYQAAKFCGKSTTEIRNALNSAHDDYDEEFAILWAEAELDEGWMTEDKMKQKALHHGDMNAIKQLLPTLPEVGKKYRKEQARSTGNVLGVIFTVGNQNRAIDAVKEVLGTAKQIEGIEGDLPEPSASLVP